MTKRHLKNHTHKTKFNKDHRNNARHTSIFFSYFIVCKFYNFPLIDFNYIHYLHIRENKSHDITKHKDRINCAIIKLYIASLKKIIIFISNLGFIKLGKKNIVNRSL